ncbi:MAG: glycosyltransferase family 4 protein [Alphaproteobacteria bacterium]|nr:glycosyltransferase family 4 protein [Alphaproteobacteria bacterium]
MRIAQIAPLFESVPPRLYGGTERVVHWLTESLVAAGHDVTLFASGDSRTSATLVPVRDAAARFVRNFEVNNAPYARMIELVRRQADAFDVLHFHIDFHPFSVFTRQPTPFVTTLHGRLDQEWVPSVYGLFPTAPLVSISDSQRAPAPTLPFAATILHGMPADLLAPTPGSLTSNDQGYFAFLGRISPEKGIVDAIRIARACNMPLKIAAKIGEEDLPFHEEIVAPLMAEPGIEFIGEIDDSHKPAFLSGAKALLFPIAWPEPFGLVMIEAMACGCPVIAYNRGSVPEVIEPGRTGFIVSNVEESVAAIAQLPNLPRASIRARFEERWTAKRMADDYVKLYQTLMDRK